MLKKTNKKLGRKIRTPKKMMELFAQGRGILFSPDGFGFDVFEVNCFFLENCGFVDTMENIVKGKYFEIKGEK